MYNNSFTILFAWEKENSVTVMIVWGKATTLSIYVVDLKCKLALNMLAFKMHSL
jgi:hypothetical protein